MDLKISKYKNHMQKFSNVVLGSSIIALLLSLQAPPSGFNLFIKQVFTFAVMFLAILHGWWRNSELYTTAKAKTSGVYVTGMIRIFLLLLAILWVRSQSLFFGIANVQFQVLFGILTISLWVGFIPQVVFLKPLYGKERVFQKRALLTDLFYAVSATLFVVGLTFLPNFFGSFWGVGILLIAIALSRGIAVISTQWSEPLPPHRGGRGRRYDSRRQDSGTARGQARARTSERRPAGERRSASEKKFTAERRTSGERRPSKRTPGDTQRDRKPSTAAVQENSSSVNGSNRTQRTQTRVTPRPARSRRTTNTDKPKPKQEKPRNIGSKKPETPSRLVRDKPQIPKPLPVEQRFESLDSNTAPASASRVDQAPTSVKVQEKDSASEVKTPKTRYGRGKSRRGPGPSTKQQEDDSKGALTLNFENDKHKSTGTPPTRNEKPAETEEKVAKPRRYGRKKVKSGPETEKKQDVDSSKTPVDTTKET